MVSGWIGNDVANAFGADRAWEVSLQLHMGALSDPQTAKALGRALRAIVPSCFVKVPFRPDLEAEGVPVNFTSTFSARQVVAAVLLADVTRTNIFMGRLNQASTPRSSGSTWTSRRSVRCGACAARPARSSSLRPT
jgi:transaldolase